MKLTPRGFLVISLALVMMITGCNIAPAAKVEPTIDMAALKAELVSTIVAQITADAPKATPTAAPSATLPVVLTATQPVIPTADGVPTLTKAPLSTFTAAAETTRYPTWTATPYTDRATLSYQSLADGITLTRGQDFDVKWVIKNQGVRNWNEEFYIKYIGGIKAQNFDHVMLSPINKGGETTFVADFIAPTNPGFYITQWGLVNDDNVTFFRFNFTFNVK
jgi:hypothetical protein